MLNIGVTLRSAALRRTDVRLTPWNLRALILNIWRSRLYTLLKPHIGVVRRLSSLPSWF